MAPLVAGPGRRVVSLASKGGKHGDDADYSHGQEVEGHHGFDCAVRLPDSDEDGVEPSNTEESEDEEYQTDNQGHHNLLMFEVFFCGCFQIDPVRTLYEFFRRIGGNQCQNDRKENCDQSPVEPVGVGAVDHPNSIVTPVLSDLRGFADVDPDKQDTEPRYYQRPDRPSIHC